MYLNMYFFSFVSSLVSIHVGLGGATVARLIPGQKVACSNHVRVSYLQVFGM